MNFALLSRPRTQAILDGRLKLVSPQQLSGKRVGMVAASSSMAAWMRGVLDEEYHLSRSSPLWLTLTRPSRRARVEAEFTEIPEGFVGEEIEAWEELDGYSHSLERRERFLLSLLGKGELDAVVSFRARIASSHIRPLLGTEEELWSHYRNKGVYPINHIFVVREEVFNRFPEIGEVLLSTLKQARRLWADYLPGGKREAVEREVSRLGRDPFAYELGEVERRSLETFIGYLLEEEMISRRLPLAEAFYRGVTEI